MTRLPWWVWLLIAVGAWLAAALAVALVLARIVHRRDAPPPEYWTPQLDWPLWRGTDLDRPSRPIAPGAVAGGQIPPPEEQP